MRKSDDKISGRGMDHAADVTKAIHVARQPIDALCQPKNMCKTRTDDWRGIGDAFDYRLRSLDRCRELELLGTIWESSE
jgi:hypothetical protein